MNEVGFCPHTPRHNSGSKSVIFPSIRLELIPPTQLIVISEYEYIKTYEGY